VILFEMLSGRRPADGDEVEAIVASVVSGNVRHLADLEPRLPPGLVAVVERALRPDREARFGSAQEMRSALIPFADPLSHAVRLATNSEPAPRAPSNAPPHSAPAQGFEVAGAIPKTLPPEADPAMLAYKGGTQEVSDEAVREALRASALPGHLPPAYGYPPAPATYGPPPAARKRRSRTGLWIGLSLLIVLGLGGAALAAVFYQQHQPDTSAPPLVLDTPAPETTVSPLIDAGAGAQVGASPPIFGVPPSRVGTATGTPTSGPTVRPTDAGTPVVADAGHNTLPFPFQLPSTLPPLPSTLPPLPSTFPSLPKTFPSTFPTALPPGFPQIPGFPQTPPPAQDGGK